MIILYDNINKGCLGEFDHVGDLLKVGRAKEELDRLVALLKDRRAGVDFDSLRPLLKIRRARDEYRIDWINRLLEMHSELENMLAVDIYLKMRESIFLSSREDE